MKAWLFQDHRRKEKFGEEKCPWSVGWIDPDGVKRSKKVGSEGDALKYAGKIEHQLITGTYQSNVHTTWEAFRKEYEETIVSKMKPNTKEATLQSLNHFQRVAKPKRLRAIKKKTVDAFISKRLGEKKGRKKGSTTSPATINKDLRHLKAVLRIAHDWGYLPEVPKIKMLKEPEKLVVYVTPEHFADTYQACDAARWPKHSEYTAGDWWRALLVFNYMTGWRISEPLALRWDDASLDKGTAITRHGDNKGGRDEVAPLHPVVVEHLRKLVDASISCPMVFYWPHARRTLYAEYARIQYAAGINLPCREDHKHTAACHQYGFHDLRRAFASENEATLSANALQKLMRHKSYTTTKWYINMARQITKAVDKLYVPDVLRSKEVG